MEVFIGDREFTIARETRWYDDVASASIRAIEAHVLGSRQLDLRIMLEQRDGTRHRRTHTCVGSFAVEWDEA